MTNAVSEFILASASPRRRDLLAGAGYRFKVVVPPLEEPAESAAGLSPAEQAEALAYFKARSVLDVDAGEPVLGADTLVAAGGEVLGKPQDESEARTMLRRLSGTRHEVITGVALLWRDGRRRIDSARTFITMRRMTAAELDDYISRGEWIGKAGAYAIQETADRFVERVEGSFSNVVGLPLELVKEMLEDSGRPDGRGAE